MFKKSISVIIGIILLFFTFQNCSPDSSSKAIDSVQQNIVNTVPDSEFTKYDISNYYPNYFKTTTPSKILSISPDGKILIDSTMIELSGLIEIDAKSQFKAKKINGLVATQLQLKHPSKHIVYSNDGKYLLALFPSNATYRDSLKYTYGYVDEVKLATYGFDPVYRELHIYKAEDFSLLKKIEYVVGFVQFKNKNTIGIQYIEDRKVSNIVVIKFYDIESNIFYDVSANIKNIIDIKFFDDSEIFYYLNQDGIWSYNYYTKEQTKISDIFKNNSTSEIAGIDNEFIYINSAEVFPQLFYYDRESRPIGCSSSARYRDSALSYFGITSGFGCSYFNYIYKINLKSKSISIYPDKAIDNLNVLKVGYFLYENFDNKFILLNAGRSFFYSTSGSTDKYIIKSLGQQFIISNNWKIIVDFKDNEYFYIYNKK